MPPRPTLEPRAMVLDDQVREGHARQIQRGPAHGVLEAGERRLGGQGRPGERIALEQELVDGVLGQPRAVVAIGVAAGDPEDALLHQLAQRVLDLAGLPPIGQAGRQPSSQPQAVVEGLEQHGPPIRAGVSLVEPGDDGRAQPLAFEGHLRYTVCSHRASWRSGYEASRHRFYSTVEGLGGCSVSSFTHKAG